MSAYPDGLDVRPLTTWLGELTPAHKRTRAQFSATLGSTLGLLTRELAALRCQHPVLEVAIPAGDAYWRTDGRPRAHARADHPGIVLSLPSSSAGPLRYATDMFTTWQDNLRAIALGLEALRKVDRYGITRRGEQYAGFRALPPGTGSVSEGGMTPDEAVRVVLDLSGETQWPLQPDEQRRVLRTAKRRTHPDTGGRRVDWDLLGRAEVVIAKAGVLTAP